MCKETEEIIFFPYKNENTLKKTCKELVEEYYTNELLYKRWDDRIREKINYFLSCINSFIKEQTQKEYEKIYGSNILAPYYQLEVEFDEIAHELTIRDKLNETESCTIFNNNEIGKDIFHKIYTTMIFPYEINL